MTAGQWMTLLEKNHYPFRHYPRNPCACLVFPGCSFPAQFPNTMARLSQICAENGAGIAHDCCGKPIAELNREKDTARISAQLEARLHHLGVEELVTLCPNCRDYLGRTCSVPVTDLFTKLAQWGVVYQGAPLQGMLFLPCPDRKERTLYSSAGARLPLEELSIVEGVPCCGLRGDISAHGPQAGNQLCALTLEKTKGKPLYTYCASCSGQFCRHGIPNVRHLLSALLGVEESPDVTHALWNRAKLKWN